MLSGSAMWLMVGFKGKSIGQRRRKSDNLLFEWLCVSTVEEKEKRCEGLLKALEPSRQRDSQNNRRCLTIEET